MGPVRRRRRREPGGIVALAELIETHKAAFEYDWRARFHLPLSSVGTSMTWGEAYRLTQVLVSDPSSAVAASVSGWEHPSTREALVFMDLYDLQHASKVKANAKPKPYPRPWPDRKTTRTRPDTRLSQEQILAALRMAGHHGPVPEAPA